MPNQSEYKVRILNESNITPELDSSIKESLIICYPHRTEQFSHCRWLNNNTPDFTTILEHNGKVVAHIATIERMITVGVAPVRVAAVGNVGVIPEHRGKRLCGMAIKAAMAEAKFRRYDAGLLFCQKHVARVYAHNGWIEMPDMPVTYLENNKPVQLQSDRFVMFYPLNLSEFPQGPADLNGPRW
jgi:predicted GNAT family N-acyltransferase